VDLNSRLITEFTISFGFRRPDDISVAVAKEKQIKTWRRRWKTNLVEFENPGWLDLVDGWYE